MVVHAQRGQEEIILAPLAMTNTQTHSAVFDTFGASYATIRVLLSSEPTTDGAGPTISLASSETSNGVFVTVTADRAAEDITAAKSVTYHVDCRTEARYLRLTLSTAEDDTHDDVTVSASGTLTRMSEEPAGASDMGNSTNEVVVIV